MIDVFVILGNGWNRERLVEDLEGEDYKHNFYIGDMKKPNEFQKYMNRSQEVWTFGDCSENIMYLYALRNFMDIWRMG